MGVLYGNHPDTNAEQREQVRALARELRPCFAFSMSDCTGYTGDQGDFRIELDTDQPIFCQPRRHSPAEKTLWTGRRFGAETRMATRRGAGRARARHPATSDIPRC